MNTNSITSLPLNEKDKEKLQFLVDFGAQIVKKTSRSVGIFITPFLVFIYFTSTTKVFIQTSVILLVSSILGLILCFNHYYKIHLDLKSGTKARYILSYYEIKRTKKDLILKSKELKLDLSFYDDIVPYINTKQPLIVEITKRNKTLLFLSHSETNLLD